MPNNNPQQTTPQQQIQRAADSATKAAERLGEGAEHVTSMAIDKVRQVRDEAQSGIEQQRTQVAERIRRLGGVMRASSQTLSTDDPMAQQLFDSAGDRIEQVADYIATLTPGALASDVTSLARRRPGLFFGGSFIIGLALGRFVKSTAGVAASGGAEGDSYEDTLAVRPAARRRAPGATQSNTSSGARSTSSQGGAATTAAAKPAGSAGGSASAQGAGSAPSYSAASSVATASRPAQSSSSMPASGTARDVERGEGSKS